MLREGRSVGLASGAADAEIIQRLRSANGHLQAVIAMVEAGEPCEAILHQLGAVQAAIRSTTHTLIRCQVQQIASNLLNDPCSEMQANSVMKLSNLYSLLIKTQSYR